MASAPEGYTLVACANEGCHYPMCIPEAVNIQLRDKHTTFYCLNGHGNHYPRPKPPSPPPRDYAKEAAEKEAADKARGYSESFGCFRGICQRCDAKQPRGSKKVAGARNWVRYDHGRKCPKRVKA